MKNEKEFHNMVDYAKENLKTFDEEPFNEVDSLILSWISYLYFDEDEDICISPTGISIKDVFKAESFTKMFDKIWSPAETMELLIAVIASPRFRNSRIRYYKNEMRKDINLQFAAMTFSLKPDMHYVAYRGTDWSITGWREDLLLASKDPVGAQILSATYLNEIGEGLGGELIVGGHSKGGHLAVYASINCKKEVQDRITVVYSHDGPGFLAEDMNKESFERIKDRIRKTIPHASYVGMLFKSETEPKIVQSNGVSVMQHNPISWRVNGLELYEDDNNSRNSKQTATRINNMMDALDETEIEVFINTFFDILDKTGIKTIDEIAANLKKTTGVLMKAVKNLEPKLKKFFIGVIKLAVFGGKKKVGDLDIDQTISDIRSNDEIDDKYEMEILEKELMQLVP